MPPPPSTPPLTPEGTFLLRQKGTFLLCTNILMHEVDDPVRILDNGARRRAGLQTAGVLTVHASILADEPFEVALGVDPFREAHEREHFGRQIRRVVVRAGKDADLGMGVVPL